MKTVVSNTICVLLFNCAGVLAGPGAVRFERRLLLVNPNEGCVVAEVDRDGRLDVIAGTHWFAAPEFPQGPGGNVRVRHLGSHPLAMDNSVQAEGYTVTDLYFSHRFSDHWQGVLTVENLFDVDVKEAQTWFESQLPGETAPVFDNHFSPGYPFTLRLGIQYEF